MQGGFLDCARNDDTREPKVSQSLVTSHQSLLIPAFKLLGIPFPRIVISSVSEKSLSFATKQAMFGTLKRETFYPLPFGHRPIYIRGEAATFIPNS